jgi:hypothetical protein
VKNKKKFIVIIAAIIVVFGVRIISDSGMIYELMLDRNAKTTSTEEQVLVDENIDVIKMLYEKAESMWGTID